MSGGGLLEKAMGQQMSSDGESMVNEVVAEALPQSIVFQKICNITPREDRCRRRTPSIPYDVVP